MTSTTEDTQIHRSVLLDHKMIINGIQYHEKKELLRSFNEDDGVEMSTLSHMRSTGEVIEVKLVSWTLTLLNNLNRHWVGLGW